MLKIRSSLTFTTIGIARRLREGATVSCFLLGISRISSIGNQAKCLFFVNRLCISGNRIGSFNRADESEVGVCLYFEMFERFHLKATGYELLACRSQSMGV